MPDDPPGDISSPSGDEYESHSNNSVESEDEDEHEMMDVPSDEEVQLPAKKKNKVKSNKRGDVVAARMVPPKDNKGKRKVSAGAKEDVYVVCHHNKSLSTFIL